MTIGTLHKRAGLRLVVSLTASCEFLTAIYQYISIEMTKKIYVPSGCR